MSRPWGFAEYKNRRKDNQTKHVRTHTHKLKPLNHFTVVPQPLSPLRFNRNLGGEHFEQSPQGLPR